MPIMSFSSLVLSAGWLLVVMAVILSICKIHLPGIRTLYIEAAGVFLVCLILGQQKMFGLFFGLVLPGCIIAGLVDSFIWEKQKFNSSPENVKKESWLINMMMMALSSLAFLIGYVFLR